MCGQICRRSVCLPHESCRPACRGRRRGRSPERRAAWALHLRARSFPTSAGAIHGGSRLRSLGLHEPARSSPAAPSTAATSASSTALSKTTRASSTPRCCALIAPAAPAWWAPMTRRARLRRRAIACWGAHRRRRSWRFNPSRAAPISSAFTWRILVILLWAIVATARPPRRATSACTRRVFGPASAASPTTFRRRCPTPLAR